MTVVLAEEDVVRQALIDGGERPYRARGRSAGFVVGHDADGMITVRWRVPRGRDDGARLGYLEQYAGILRAAGLRAFVTLAAPEARVLCLRDVARRFPEGATVDPSMEQIPHPRDPAVVLAAGRVLDVVAGGLVLEGTIAEVARQLGAPAGTLRVALRELRRVGWVAVQTTPPDRVTVRPERRLPDRQAHIPIDRRQSSEDAWAL